MKKIFIFAALLQLAFIAKSEPTEKDRSLNEIKDDVNNNYQYSTDNTIPTLEPQTAGDANFKQDYDTTISTSKPEVKSKVTPDKAPNHQRTTKKPRDALDPLDQYLLDGILQIVDDKFDTINKRIMTLEKGINNLQYYNVRSFRVVNTHLHAVDTILHGITSEINQVELKNREMERAIGSVKNEMSDLQTMNTGMFQAIEQNLVHFHKDITSRLSEFESDLDVTNEQISGIKNDTKYIKFELDTLKADQNDLVINTGDIRIKSAETAHSAELLVNVTLGILQESAVLTSNVDEISMSLVAISRNVSDISALAGEIKNDMAVYRTNASAEMKDEDIISSSGELMSDKNTQELRVQDSQTFMTCSKMFELLDAKLKTIKLHQNTSCRITDSEEFKNDSKNLLKALSVVNENVLQSVTMYRHAGDLIERVISETEFIATEQVKLRGDIQDFLVNNSMYLEYLAQINQTLDLAQGSAATILDTPTTAIPKDARCDVSAGILDAVTNIVRNNTEVVELLTNLAETSTTALKETVGYLQTEVTKLRKVKQDHPRRHAYSKVNLARDDPKAGYSSEDFKDLKNTTDWIYKLVEAVASNTGWIPYVFHNMRFIESQVNKTLKLSYEISERTEETLIRQRMESKIYNKVTAPTTPPPSLAKVLSKEILSTTRKSTPVSTARPPQGFDSRKVSASDLGVSNSSLGHMMEFVYETNVKIDRLIPALTNLLGEPEPYITLVGGESDREGRVEIYYKGIWGTVCETLSHVEASYVCRNLGFLGGVSAGNGFFGAGSGPFWNLNVTCLHTHYCDAVKPVITPGKCDHNTDFAVICEHMLRLTSEDDNEIQRNTGMLEIFHDNRWSPVCAKGWDRNETSVACRQLGFHEGAATAIKDDSLKDTYWMKNVTCKGHENRLDACAFDGFIFNACPDFKHVSVICS